MPPSLRGWLWEWVRPGGLAIAVGVIASGVTAYFTLESRVSTLERLASEGIRIDDKQWARIEGHDVIARKVAERLATIQGEVKAMADQQNRIYAEIVRNRK